MMQYIQSLLNGRQEKDETGASAVEYGLLIAGIAAVVAVAVLTLGTTVSGVFTNTNTCVGTPTAGNC